jgi:hypothetical protein
VIVTVNFLPVFAESPALRWDYLIWLCQSNGLA